MNFFYPPQPTRLWPNAPILKQFERDQNYVSEIKYNGWRLEIHIDPKCPIFYNRQGTIININPKIFDFKNVPPLTVFDGELVHFRTKDVKNVIVLWDCMFWDGKDLRNLHLEQRQPFLDVFSAAPRSLTKEHEGRVFHITHEKRHLLNFYEEIVKKNDPLEEGMVVKNLQSKYEYSVKRSFETAQWFKIKKIADSSLAQRS